MKYTINLVRQIRLDEKKAVERKNRIFTLAASSVAVLIVSMIILVFQLLRMETKLKNERQELNRIELEYGKYKSTRMVIDKADIERLDSLQSNRVFWTKKLAAMAYYLPNNYWITKFGFDGKQMQVSGYGYISTQQEQLITLDDYLNKLRVDSTYTDIFKATYFNSVQRSDDQGKCRVSFDFSSIK